MIYQKSAKGSQAMAARDRALTPKMRSTLLLIDGKRSYGDLVKLSGVLGTPDETLDALLEQAFIEPVRAATAARAAETGAADSAPSAAASVTMSVPLPEARRFAARRLTDLLGPNAESLCLRIEAARTASELLQAVRRAEAVLREFGGERMASAFMNEMRSCVSA